MKVEIAVKTFERGTLEETVRKVCEEATELYGAYSVWVEGLDACEDDEGIAANVRELSMLTELGDVLTAAFNVCQRIGADPQACVKMAQTKNLARGYYGNPHEVALEWKRDAWEDSSSD